MRVDVIREKKEKRRFGGGAQKNYRKNANLVAVTKG